MGRKSNVSDTKQSEAVLALLRREEPAAVLARRYGVSESTLVRRAVGASVSSVFTVSRIVSLTTSRPPFFLD